MPWPVQLCNDATAACAAELVAGKGRFRDFLYIFCGSFIGGGLVFVTLAGLIYHFFVGAKHLVQDFGIGESLEGGRAFAWLALLASGFFILCAFLWMVL